MRTELTIMELRQKVQQLHDQPNRDALLESYEIVIRELEKLLSFYLKGTWL
jgi:hypothetical protein